jgi:hypothetical protein
MVSSAIGFPKMFLAACILGEAANYIFGVRRRKDKEYLDEQYNWMVFVRPFYHYMHLHLNINYPHFL